MSKTIQCSYLGKEAEGLERAPYPGELGQRILDNICKEAWQLWMKHQTILINENRLSPIDPKHRAFLEEQMQKFLFEGGAEIPESYVPPAN